MTAVSQLLPWIGPHRQPRDAQPKRTGGTWLGVASNWLLEQWIDRPELICGDADVSLLIMVARDLAEEDGILMRRFRH
jgi:hypothetical protein